MGWSPVPSAPAKYEISSKIWDRGQKSGWKEKSNKDLSSSPNPTIICRPWGKSLHFYGPVSLPEIVGLYDLQNLHSYSVNKLSVLKIQDLIITMARALTTEDFRSLKEINSARQNFRYRNIQYKTNNMLKY